MRQGGIFYRIPEDCLLDKFPSFDGSGKSFPIFSPAFDVANSEKASQLENISQLGNIQQLGNYSHLPPPTKRSILDNATQLKNAYQVFPNKKPTTDCFHFPGWMC